MSSPSRARQRAHSWQEWWRRAREGHLAFLGTVSGYRTKPCSLVQRRGGSVIPPDNATEIKLRHALPAKSSMNRAGCERFLVRAAGSHEAVAKRVRSLGSPARRPRQRLRPRPEVPCASQMPVEPGERRDAARDAIVAFVQIRGSPGEHYVGSGGGPAVVAAAHAHHPGGGELCGIAFSGGLASRPKRATRPSEGVRMVQDR